MTTTLGFKDIITLPQWRPLTGMAYGITFGAGNAICGDLRNNEDRHPVQFILWATTDLSSYHFKQDGFGWLANPSMAGSLGAGTAMVFAPSQGPSGTLAAGATTTSVVINTALPAAVGANQLANRGDGVGYKIRIIGLSALGSGKTEERYIVGNTLGTQPTITLDSALSFTPAATDRYEILSGRLYMLTSSSAGGWKYYDVATNSVSGNLSVTNLPTVNTDSSLISLDELHVPYTRAPGEGYFGKLVATAIGATSITGQAALGDVAVLQNEYRNFQIRIVEDTAIPTAVGQRRNITSHTAGASPIYTVAAWSVQPSATATYVIENNTDRIILWTGGAAATYCYNVTANTWDTTTFASRVQVMAAGCVSVHSFGIALDAGKNARYSHIHSFRGGAATLDIFDIAGAATGAWTLGVTYVTTLRAALAGGTSICYCPATEQGRYAYLNDSVASTFQHTRRYDVRNRVMETYAYLPYNNGGTTMIASGRRMESCLFVDGTTKMSFVNMFVSQSVSTFWQCAITR